MDTNITFYCETAAHLAFFTVYSIQNAVKSFVAISSLFIIIYYILRRSFWIHGQRNGLIIFKVFILLLYSFNNIACNCYPFILRRLFESIDPCEFVFTSPGCLPFKIAHMCLSFSLSLAFLFVVIERAIVIFYIKNPPKTKGKVAPLQENAVKVFIGIQMIVIIVIVFVSIFSQEDTFVYVLNCTEDTPSMIPIANALSFLGISIDVITVFGNLSLLHFCSRQIRRRSATKKSLELSYQLRYSQLSLCALSPVILFHAITVILYNLLSIAIRSWFPDLDYVTRKTAQGLINFYPYYTLLCPLFYVVAIAKMKRRFAAKRSFAPNLSREAEFSTSVHPVIGGRIVSPTEHYFLVLNQMWA